MNREEIMEEIARLQDLLGCPSCGQEIDGAHFCPGPQPRYKYDMSDCGCRRENGGSGVCGCILSGPTIT